MQVLQDGCLADEADGQPNTRKLMTANMILHGFEHSSQGCQGRRRLRIAAAACCHDRQEEGGARDVQVDSTLCIRAPAHGSLRAAPAAQGLSAGM